MSEMMIRGATAVAMLMQALRGVDWMTELEEDGEVEMWVSFDHEPYDHNRAGLLIATRRGDSELEFYSPVIHESGQKMLLSQTTYAGFRANVSRLVLGASQKYESELAAELEEDRRQEARELGMGLGIEAYNDHMGYGSEEG